jgi:FAD/FMN-containing dehydrogenase
MADQSAINQWHAGLRGRLIRPGDAEYDASRQVYNAMIDKKPAMILEAANVSDVIAAVNFAREQDMLLSIRGGGHNAGGLGVCDDGLVIDLKNMRGIRIDPVAQTARVEGGATWGEVDHAGHAFGLATPAGIISTTGVAGLTLGGGIGHLTRKYGLTVDNLLEADLVLADGSFTTVNEKTHPDLYWALRGGGGNFGVVTSFKFQMHPVHTDYGGLMLWPLDQGPEILHWYREFILNAPDDLNGFFAFLTVPPTDPFPKDLWGLSVTGIVWCYTGDHAQAAEVFKPIREMGNVLLDWVGPIPHPALNSMFDPFYPPGLQWYWRADFYKEIPDAAIEAHMKYAKQLPSGHSTMHLYPINGKAHQPSNSGTPFSYREANWAGVIVGVDPDPANKAAITDWCKGYWEELHPYSSGGAYVNFMMEEGQERVRATYRDNYDRLARIKAKYDPGNLFRVNQNIKPA